MKNLRRELSAAKRIVIKVGTSTLTHENGKVNLTRMDRLAMVISDLRNKGKEVILVTSGAIGAGTGKLNLSKRPSTIREKQAVAAVGQCELMHIYSKLFGEYGHVVGQILLTQVVIGDEHARTNVINTFNTLLEMGVIPIVNENDSVSVEEIKIGQKNIFSENDTLSATVAALIKANLLIILSDIDGFFDCDPKKNKCSHMIPLIKEITPEIEKCAGGTGSSGGRGGMVTKLNAAKKATSAGVNVVLANGSSPEIINDIIEGREIGTLFAAVKI